MANHSEDIQSLGDENHQDVERLRQQVEDQRVTFVLTEIDTGITFCQVALSTSDPEKRSRNIENALIGLRTALRFAQTPERDLRTDDGFRKKLAHLQDLLRELGQQA